MIYHRKCVVRKCTFKHTTTNVLLIRWISISSSFCTWTAQSPDLTPSDFFVEARSKRILYEENSKIGWSWKIKLLKQIIFATNVTPQIISNAMTSLLQCVRLCIKCGGGHVEHLL